MTGRRFGPHGPAVPALAGCRVLVTRPRDAAADLVAELRAHGAEPLLLPTIRVVPPEDAGPLDAAMAELAAYDWLVFTSARAVAPFLTRAGGERTDGVDLDGPRGAHRPRVAAVGPQTAASLAAGGWPVDVVPRTFTSNDLAGALGDLAGQRILLPRSNLARRDVVDGLRARGARVDDVVAYRTVVAEPDPVALAALTGRGVDVATFASGSAVRGLAALAALIDPRPLAAVLAGAHIACIGPSTADVARATGLEVDIEATGHTGHTGHTATGLVAAIVAFYQAEARQREEARTHARA